MCIAAVTKAQTIAPLNEIAVVLPLALDFDLLAKESQTNCNPSGKTKMAKVKREKIPRLANRPKRQDHRVHVESSASLD